MTPRISLVTELSDRPIEQPNLDEEYLANSYLRALFKNAKS